MELQEHPTLSAPEPARADGGRATPPGGARRGAQVTSMRGWLSSGLPTSFAAIVLLLGIPLYVMGYNFAQAASCELGATEATTCPAGSWGAFWSGWIVVAFVVVVALALALAAALALAKLRFDGRRRLAAVAAIQLMPIAGLVIPNYLDRGTTYESAPLLRHVAVVALVYLLFVLPCTVWVLKRFVLDVPRDLEEAAMLDGATQFGAFTRVVLPLIAPGLAAVAIFAFISAWNEWLFATALLGGGGKETLMMSFYRLGGGDEGVPYGTVMAMATLAALPVALLFVLVHRRVASGLGAGPARS